MTTASSYAVLTFLFTDIEGSTRRWEADADAMRAALQTHDSALTDAVTTAGGDLFKHTGDGICAAFTSPRAAVDAAVAAQLTLELPVRMGIATGEAELRGDDYFGAVLNRTARIMSAGHGGQILLDGLTAGLLSGVDLKALGNRHLRDIAEPVAVFQVRAPGLRTEFAKLRTDDPTPGNLRPPTTSFIGRDADLAELDHMLRTRRLVTLTGVGGVGKTRLALEAASRLATEFPDGVWVVELAAVGDPAAVPEAVAAVLGIHQQAGMTLADSVAAALEGRTRLLVLDNCEHVVDTAADLVEKILARSTTVRILATSREGLRARDERLWPVRPLSVDSAAPTLFLDRGRDVIAGSSLTTGEDAAAIVEICRRLDGIPLAIELAASRLQSMTVSEVRDRLDDRFRLLVGSRRGLERHQTLRHAVAWSFDLLDDAERVLLQRCSVFSGGFDLEAASAIGGGDDFVTLDLLDSLVRKSLVVADHASDRTRFSMLETIRQLAEEQLVTAGRAEETRDAHAHYFAGRESDVLELWASPRQREAYTWFHVELPNLRTAFRRAADNQDLDTAAALAVYATFLGGWVEQNEPMQWAEELIAPAEAIGHRRLAQLYAMASQCNRIGRFDDCIRYIEACQTAGESPCFDELRDEVNAWLAGGYMVAGLPERAIKLCRDGLTQSPGIHAYTRSALSYALTITGNYDEAMAVSQDLLGIADALGNPEVIVGALLAYGVAFRFADPVAASAALRRGLTLAQESGNRQMESVLAVNLSRSAADVMEALDCLTLAIGNYYDAGSFSQLPGPLAILVYHFDRLQHYQTAATVSQFAATPLARTAFPEISAAIPHLRETLGDEVYTSFAEAGTAMTTAEMATYALEQIDLARAELR